VNISDNTTIIKYIGFLLIMLSALSILLLLWLDVELHDIQDHIDMVIKNVTGNKGL